MFDLLNALLLSVQRLLFANIVPIGENYTSIGSILLFFFLSGILIAFVLKVVSK